MFPLWVIAVFAALGIYFTSVQIPRQEAAVASITADVSATNFLAYRQAVRNYIRVNPSATGTVTDANLASHWLPGYIRDANWTNTVASNTLFVYSSSPVPSGTQLRVYQKTGETILVGTKSAATGRLVSQRGVDTGVVLPVAIPNGSFVMVGR